MNHSPDRPLPVLVVGATGFLGRQVAEALQGRGLVVRALVRPQTDPAALLTRGIEVVRGNLLDRRSLDAALTGVDAVVTSAVGYTQRPSAATAAADTEGNRNLADAVRATGVRRLVFTGILASDQAPGVPHFRDKTNAEEYFTRVGVPYVSLRPGAYLDQVMRGMPGGGPGSGRLFSLGSPDVPMTWVLSADVAAALAAAVNAPATDGEHIDIGWDRPVSMRELAALAATRLGRPVRVRPVPWPLLSAGLGAAGLVDRRAADARAMFRFFLTGRFRADPARQREVLGGVPTAEEAVARWLPSSPAATRSAA